MRKPTYGSLFSGIGGMDLGIHRAGFECKWQVELDDWRRQILERHWPSDLPLGVDIRDVGATNLETVDLIGGGFPCQDLSVAGKRAGLDGKRSGLFFEFMRVAEELKPQWILIENVPGLLSSHQGEDMGVVLEAISELGYGVAWTVLDSQYFGVPQRRRRVYIIGCLGRPCPPEILFEFEGGGGNPSKGRETRESQTTLVASTLVSPGQQWNSPQAEPNLVCAPTDPDRVRETSGISRWLDACPRCSDAKRYAALGDANTVPVIEWIGRRIIRYGGFE